MRSLTQDEQQAVDFFKRGGPEANQNHDYYKVPYTALGTPVDLDLRQTLMNMSAREMARVEDQKILDILKDLTF